MKDLELVESEKTLLEDIKNLIKAARDEANKALNCTLVMLNWSIGLKRIKFEHPRY